MAFRRTNSIVSPLPTGNSLNSELISWWICLPNRMAGNVWFDIFNRYHGTLTAMSGAASGWGVSTRQSSWGTMQFDGVDDYVDCGTFTKIDGIANQTIAFWAKRAATNKSILVGKRGATPYNNIDYHSDGVAYFEMYPAFGSVASAGADWVHLAMTYDGTQSTNATKLKAFINGRVQTLSFSGTVPTTTPAAGNFFIGKDNSAFSTGSIDDVRVYKRTLSDTEIADLYNDSLHGYRKTLHRTGRRFGRAPRVGKQTLIQVNQAPQHASTW